MCIRDRPGDAAQWLQNRYGWSWNKINNLAKAVCFAKQYFGDHGLCGYALVQDLIWSEIQPYEDAGETGYLSLIHISGMAYHLGVLYGTSGHRSCHQRQCSIPDSR